LVKEDNKYYRKSSTMAFDCIHANILPKRLLGAKRLSIKEASSWTAACI
jgi:hypothetical protein